MHAGCDQNIIFTTLAAAAVRSGMLPGFVSGFYGVDDCHVDLARLAQYAGAALILAPAPAPRTSRCACIDCLS